MNFYTELALKTTGKVALGAACLYWIHITRPLGEINHGVAVVGKSWVGSKAEQSLKDRYSAGKVTLSDYEVEAHTHQAKEAWLMLSKRYTKQRDYLEQVILRTYPRAENWK